MSMKFNLSFNATIAIPFSSNLYTQLNHCLERNLPFASMKFQLSFNTTIAKPFVSKFSISSNHCLERKLPFVSIKFHLSFNSTIEIPYSLKLYILSNPLKSPFLAKYKAFSNFSLNNVDGLNTSQKLTPNNLDNSSVDIMLPFPPLLSFHLQVMLLHSPFSSTQTANIDKPYSSKGQFSPIFSGILSKPSFKQK